jgi:hypothetical protein
MSAFDPKRTFRAVAPGLGLTQRLTEFGGFLPFSTRAGSSFF